MLEKNLVCLPNLEKNWQESVNVMNTLSLLKVWKTPRNNQKYLLVAGLNENIILVLFTV